ncbi:unnamed protein product [Heligmosomoides polygyrus]|uniref:Uncharacterized protein n=1 Tax=Heligmosomoides polygyrus TaxID=6339 RepID=A0A183FD88_HELPZ|nr:unnamed protein product [Heligmosomoides polygyrus]
MWVSGLPFVRCRRLLREVLKLPRRAADSAGIPTSASFFRYLPTQHMSTHFRAGVEFPRAATYFRKHATPSWGPRAGSPEQLIRWVTFESSTPLPALQGMDHAGLFRPSSLSRHRPVGDEEGGGSHPT